MLGRAVRRPGPHLGPHLAGGYAHPGHSRAGTGTRVHALSPGVPAAAECHIATFSFLHGISEISPGALPGVFGARRATAGLLGLRGWRPQFAKMGRKAARSPMGRSWTHPGLPKRGDFVRVTSPVQARGAGGPEHG